MTRKRAASIGMLLILLSRALPENVVGSSPRGNVLDCLIHSRFLLNRRGMRCTTKDPRTPCSFFLLFFSFCRIIPIPHRTLTNHRFARASLTNRLPTCVQRCQALKKKVIGQHRLLSLSLSVCSLHLSFCILIPLISSVVLLFFYLFFFLV